MLSDIAQVFRPRLDLQQAFCYLTTQPPRLHLLNEMGQGVDVLAKLMLDFEDLTVNRLLKKIPIPCLP